MAKKLKAARLFNNMTMVEAGEKLGIAQPTLSAWEAERKTPSIDALERMADLYGVTTDYLLGRPEVACHEPTQPINAKLLAVLDGTPVWSERHGWMLVCVEANIGCCSLPANLFPLVMWGIFMYHPRHLFLQCHPLRNLWINQSLLIRPRFGWNPFLRIPICAMNFAVGIAYPMGLLRIARGIGLP